jgi:hypothetical protein
MESLFETTVTILLDNTRARVLEQTHMLDVIRCNTLYAAQNCKSFEELRAVMGKHNERAIETKLQQYMENYEYLLVCPHNKTVFLNQTEWRHYFHGAPVPELCWFMEHINIIRIIILSSIGLSIAVALFAIAIWILSDDLDGYDTMPEDTGYDFKPRTYRTPQYKPCRLYKRKRHNDKFPCNRTK